MDATEAVARIERIAGELSEAGIQANHYLLGSIEKWREGDDGIERDIFYVLDRAERLRRTAEMWPVVRDIFSALAGGVALFGGLFLLFSLSAAAAFWPLHVVALAAFAVLGVMVAVAHLVTIPRVPRGLAIDEIRPEIPAPSPQSRFRIVPDAKVTVIPPERRKA